MSKTKLQKGKLYEMVNDKWKLSKDQDSKYKLTLSPSISRTQSKNK